MGRLTLDKGRVLGLLVAGWNVLPVSSSSVTWQSDSISISITGSAPELRNFTLDLQASRYVLQRGGVREGWPVGNPSAYKTMYTTEESAIMYSDTK